MYILYIILAIVILLVMVLIHELGHYTFGKILGFKINEFSVGFGPAIIKKTKKNGEIISLRAFPLGGYCAFDGEDENSESSTAFNNMPAWKRLIVLFGGVFFNFLSGIIFSFILLISVGYELPCISTSDGLSTVPTNTAICYVDDTKIDFVKDNIYSDLVLSAINDGDYEEVQIDDKYYAVITVKYKQNGKLKEGEIYYSEEVLVTYINDYYSSSVAGGTGIKKGYEIVSVNGQEITFRNNFKTLMKNFIAENLTYNEEDSDTLTAQLPVSYINGSGEEVDSFLPLVYSNSLSTYTLSDGVTLGVGYSTDAKMSAYRFSFGEGLIDCVPFTFRWAGKIFLTFGQLFTGAVPLSSLGGTVTTVTTIATYSSQSMTYLLVLLPMIAVNLAVFNILPIPALDGARAIFVIIEMIRKKPINKNVEGMIHTIGLLVLLAFVIVIDVLHFTIWKT